MLEQLSAQIAFLLLETTIKAALIVGGATLLLVTFRKMSVHTQHRIWTMVLVSLLVFPLPGLTGICWSLPLSNWPSEFGRAPLSRQTAGTSSNPELHTKIADSSKEPNIESVAARPRKSPSNQVHDIDSSNLASSYDGDGPAFSDTTARAAPLQVSVTGKRNDLKWPSLVQFGVLVWIFGAGVMLARLLMSVGYVWRLKQSSMQIADATFPRDIVVRESDQIDTPVVLGCWQTCILLPRSWREWSVARRNAVFAHELAHVRRHDPQIGLLSELALVFYWFHPVSWLVRGRLGRLAELACDEMAAVTIGDRVAYARHLMEIAAAIRPRVRLPWGAAMARSSSIVERVRSLLDESTPLTDRIGRRSAVLIRVLGIPVATAIVAVHPTAAPSQDTIDSTTTKVLVPADIKAINLKPRPPVDGPVLTLRGTVLRPDGSVAKDAVLEQCEPGDIVSATIRDGEFDIRSTGTLLNPPSLLCRNSDGSLQVLIHVGGYKLRDECLQPQRMTLAPSTSIRIKVTDEQNAVANAHVQVEVGSFKFLGTTRADGIAELRIPPKETSYQMAAWTDDHRIGGLHVTRKSWDQLGNEFELEVSRGAPARVRVVDRDQKPVANVPVEFVAAHGQNDELFVGNNATSLQATDASGETLFRWVPKWSSDRSHFAIAEGRGWRRLGDKGPTRLPDGTYELMAAPSRTDERVAVESQLSGATTDVAGMLVEFWSYEGEEEGTCDVIYARSDARGNFTARLLPGSEYSVYVNDRQLVSNTWGGTIVSRDGTIQKPELKLANGMRVDVLVTRGANEEPLANAWLNFDSVQESLRGQQFWGRTDEQGRFTAPVAAGTWKIRARDGDWQSLKTINIREGEPAKIHLHRKYTVKQTISGKLVLPTGVTADLSKTTVKIAGMDGESTDATTVTSDAQGNFTAGIMAGRFSILASTPNDTFFGGGIFDLTDGIINVPILPTVPHVGVVLGTGDKPVEGVTVRMDARLTDHKREYPSGIPAFNRQFVEFFDDRTATTDANGKYSFPTTPQRIELNMTYSRPGDTESAAYNRLWLEPDESRPTAVIRLGEKESAGARSVRPLEVGVSETLLNCKVTGIHALIVVTGGGDLVAPFVARHVLDEDDDEDLQDIYSYLPRTINGPEAAQLPDRQKYFDVHKWPFPAENSIFLVAMNGTGKELGRLSLDVTNQQAAAGHVLEFLKAHRPDQQDAKAGFQAALDEAKKTGRRIWVRGGGTRCAPCYSLSQWIDAHQELLSQDYVLFKFDEANDLNGHELSVALKFDPHGIPCHAILDADGKELTNSIGPIGNIGSPVGSIEGARHLRKMFQESAQKLSPDQIESLIRSLVKE